MLNEVAVMKYKVFSFDPKNFLMLPFAVSCCWKLINSSFG